ncbi:hypothetical protein ACGF3K_14290 [Streptomyces sp. NPDC047980]|uniref:hypothetical protein n=1 Tax=unclassified Streptomyces TaxID=2593676 RepID=UPI00367ADAF8
MTTPIDRLAEIAKRTEAATPGPWTVCDDYSDVHGPGDIHLASYWNPTAGDRNGEFIAHARADIPWLLNQLRLAFGEIAELQAKLAIRERQLDDMDAAVIA